MPPLRILVVTNLYPPLAEGGYEERCRQVVDALRARGHAVQVLTSRPSLGIPPQKDPPWVQRALTPVGRFGWPWVRVPRLFSVERTNCSVLRQAITAHDAQVVQMWNLGGLGKSLLSATCGRPLVTDISDHWASGAERTDPLRNWRRRHPWANRVAWGLQRGLDQGPLNFGQAYFTSAALRASTVAATGDVRLAQASVIHCGIAVEHFSAAYRQRLAGRLRCVFAGRLHPDKGIATACAAVAACDHGVSLEVFGAGDPAYVAELHQRFAHPAIHFRGRLAPEDISRAYAAADCLVFPSSWAEPFALVPLEASVAGLPVIGTTTGGSGEFLCEGATALTFPADDVAALHGQLVRLRDDPALGQRLTETAAALVRERFTSAIMTDRIEAHLWAAVT